MFVCLFVFDPPPGTIVSIFSEKEGLGDREELSASDPPWLGSGAGGGWDDEARMKWEEETSFNLA